MVLVTYLRTIDEVFGPAVMFSFDVMAPLKPKFVLVAFSRLSRVVRHNVCLRNSVYSRSRINVLASLLQDIDVEYLKSTDYWEISDGIGPSQANIPVSYLSSKDSLLRSPRRKADVFPLGCTSLVDID